MGDSFNTRVFYNDREQEVSDNFPYAAIVKSVVEIVQSANFLGPVESNNGFTVLGVPLEGGSGGSAHIIQEEGVSLTQRAKLNFVGSMITAADDSGNNATTVTVTFPTITISGDASGSGTTSISITIANNAVTNAKLNDMATSTIKGRATAGDGDPEDLTATQVRTILNVEDGANNYSHPNHSGDVTSVGDGATTIANDAVSNAKAANMAQATIKGRQSGGGTGDPEDLTATQVRTIINVADGANAYVHPNHSGDVTSVADGAQTIANDAVSNAKMANMAQATVKGRAVGAGTGDPTDLSLLQMHTLLNTPAAMDVSGTTGTWNSDNGKIHTGTLSSNNTTVAASSGTPFEGQLALHAIKQDASVARTVSFASGTNGFAAGDDYTDTIPAMTTVLSGYAYWLWIYRSTPQKWHLLDYVEHGA